MLQEEVIDRLVLACMCMFASACKCLELSDLILEDKYKINMYFILQVTGGLYEITR